MSTSRTTTHVFKTRVPLNPSADRAICLPRPELSQVLQYARAPRVNSYVAVLGSRQTGKTTLLYQLRAELRPPRFGVVLIDLEHMQDQPEAALYSFVADKIRSELDVRSNGKSDEPLPTNSIQFQQFLVNAAQRTDAARILLLLDEIETVSPKVSTGFFSTLRGVFTTRHEEPAYQKYLVVLCGAKEVSRLTDGGNSPMNIAERIFLCDLPLEGVKKLAANFKRADISAPPETGEWLYAQTNGHPYLTQQVCSLIEQHAPSTVTQELVDQAADKLLHSDDHLEKMLLDIKEDRPAQELLQKLVIGESRRFSRLDPLVAKLEVLGVIREVNQRCAIRNQIYEEALRSHFNLGGAARATNAVIKSARLLFLILTGLLFLINVPLMINYASEIKFGEETINAVVTSNDVYAVIRYGNVIKPNELFTVTVDVDHSFKLPIKVYVREKTPDIVVRSGADREYPRGFHSNQFTFSLNQKEIPYNPLMPQTERRFVDIIFPSDANGKLTAYTAEFKVDYYSAFLTSVVVSAAGFIAFIGGLLTNLRRLGEIWTAFLRALKVAPQ
jgi:hypothetical protein